MKELLKFLKAEYKYLQEGGDVYTFLIFCGFLILAFLGLVFGAVLLIGGTF